MTPTAAGPPLRRLPDRSGGLHQTHRRRNAGLPGPPGQPGRCAAAPAASQLAAPVAAPWRRWLLAGAGAAGLAGARAGRPAGAATRGRYRQQAAKPGGQVVVRGAVIDDQNGQPVVGARVLIAGTNYGTVNDEQGASSR
ncbi:MAG: hypothetical protein WKG07_26625 [Hymenobacter sp.]